MTKVKELNERIRICFPRQIIYHLPVLWIVPFPKIYKVDLTLFLMLNCLYPLNCCLKSRILLDSWTRIKIMFLENNYSLQYYSFFFFFLILLRQQKNYLRTYKDRNRVLATTKICSSLWFLNVCKLCPLPLVSVWRSTPSMVKVSCITMQTKQRFIIDFDANNYLLLWPVFYIATFSVLK